MDGKTDVDFLRFLPLTALRELLPRDDTGLSDSPAELSRRTPGWAADGVLKPTRSLVLCDALIARGTDDDDEDDNDDDTW